MQPWRPWHKEIGIYTLENIRGKTICACDTYENNKEITVRHIETRKNSGYKFAGQNLLAMLAQKVLNTNREDLFINDGQPSAQDFYKIKCGFNMVGTNPIDDEGIDFEMKAEDIPYFLMETKDKTKAGIEFIV